MKGVKGGGSKESVLDADGNQIRCLEAQATGIFILDGRRRLGLLRSW